MLSSFRNSQAVQTLRYFQVAPSQSARVMSLAQNVQAIRPGIYRVGISIIDCWLGSCSCKEARTNQNKKCAHKLALEISELIECIPTGYTETTRKFFADAGITQPQVIATYAKVFGVVGKVRIERGNSWYHGTTTNGEDFLICPHAEAMKYISRLTPFYDYQSGGDHA